jgi:hypothetical protein
MQFWTEKNKSEYLHMEQKKYSPFPNFAIHRPISVLVSLTALLVIGYITYTQIAVELFPAGFNPPFLGVWTPYPNSNPREVEEQSNTVAARDRRRRSAIGLIRTCRGESQKIA